MALLWGQGLLAYGKIPPQGSRRGLLITLTALCLSLSLSLFFYLIPLSIDSFAIFTATVQGNQFSIK